MIVMDARSLTPEEVADALRVMIGAKPGDTITVTSSPHLRPAHWPAPGEPPKTMAEWAALWEMTGEQLAELGCGNWDGRLRLFPGEWYHRIPTGFPVEDILGVVEAFRPGDDDDDIRFGCLPNGVPAVDGVVVEDL